MSDGVRIIPDVIARHMDAIIGLCQKFYVVELELFGSAMTGDFDPETSDFDFLAEFDPDAPLRPLKQFFGFKDALEELLGRPVDLVSYRSIRNPYFREFVDRQRVELYAA